MKQDKEKRNIQISSENAVKVINAYTQKLADELNAVSKGKNDVSISALLSAPGDLQNAFKEACKHVATTSVDNNGNIDVDLAYKRMIQATAVGIYRSFIPENDKSTDDERSNAHNSVVDLLMNGSPVNQIIKKIGTGLAEGISNTKSKPKQNGTFKANITREVVSAMLSTASGVNLESQSKDRQPKTQPQTEQSDSGHTHEIDRRRLASKISQYLPGTTTFMLCCTYLSNMCAQIYDSVVCFALDTLPNGISAAYEFISEKEHWFIVEFLGLGQNRGLEQIILFN